MNLRLTGLLNEVLRAMLSHGGVLGVRVALVEAKELNVLTQDKWEGINSLNNFLYKDNGRDLTIWKAYEVGDRD